MKSQSFNAHVSGVTFCFVALLFSSSPVLAVTTAQCAKLPFGKRSACYNEVTKQNQRKSSSRTESPRAESPSVETASESKVKVLPLDESKNGVGIDADAKVECNYTGGGNYYPGTVKSVDGDKVSIDYDDGDKEETTKNKCRKLLVVDTKVECNWNKAGKLLAGKVTKQEGSTLDVAYDNGEKEEGISSNLCVSK